MRATFTELVAEYLTELEELGALGPLDRDEDAVLANLAELQRRGGRSPRSDAFVAACWRYWVENSRHAVAWRRRSL